MCNELNSDEYVRDEVQSFINEHYKNRNDVPFDYRELIDLCGKIYSRGEHEGFAWGKKDGLSDAFAKGYEKGFDNGYNRGYDKYLIHRGG